LGTQETLREINIQDPKDKGICEKKQKIKRLGEVIRRRLRVRIRNEG